METIDHRPVFVVSTGRCGSKMIADVMSTHPSVLAQHEPLPHLLTEAYLKWSGRRPPAFLDYRLRYKRTHNIEQIVANGLLYFESSHYMSHFIPELRRLFGARFVFIYRDGRTFTRSALDKGWCRTPSAEERVKTVLRRRLLMNVGNHWVDHWLKPPAECETRFEKCAWLWSEINGIVLHDLEAIPRHDQFHMKLEDFGPEAITALLDFLGIAPSDAMQESMLRIAAERPNKTKTTTHAPPSRWTFEQEARFEDLAGDVQRRLGYEIPSLAHA